MDHIITENKQMANIQMKQKKKPGNQNKLLNLVKIFCYLNSVTKLL